MCITSKQELKYIYVKTKVVNGKTKLIFHAISIHTNNE